MKTNTVLVVLVLVLFGCHSARDEKPGRRTPEMARRDSMLITGEPMACEGPDEIAVRTSSCGGSYTHMVDNPEPFVCATRGLIVLCPREMKEPCAFSLAGPTMYQMPEAERP